MNNLIGNAGRSLLPANHHQLTGKHRQLMLLLVSIAVLLLVSGCRTTGGVSEDNSFDDQSLASISDARARRLLFNGDIQAAADRYSFLADSAADAETQVDYQLVAAEILYDRGMTAEGNLKLGIIPFSLTQAAFQQRRDILQAKDILFTGEPEQALNALPDPDTMESALHRARVYEVRAQAFRQLDNPDEELAARIALEQQVNRPGIAEANHKQIWQLLTTQPQSRLNEMTTHVRGDIYQGWIELALSNAIGDLDGQQRSGSLQQWRSRFPNHPANATMMRTLFADNNFNSLELSSGPIRQVGVLLPLTAPGIGAAAAAIRDGIILAYQNETDRSNLPTIRFYDIGDNVNFVRTAFQNALNDGADAIIGPLRKQAVTSIVTQRNLPVPVITLNQVEVPGSSQAENVIQFGLAPEDEARSAARRALALDYNNAIVLKTDDSRGDREARAFTELMLLNGGEVLHTAILPADEYDYSQQLKDALLITQSDQRFRKLSRTIDAKLFFEPGIRGDVDMVFLAVNNDQAKSVRPQLAFFHAAELPKFGTSRVAAIDNDVKANRDLNTIHYTDAPWVLDKDVRNSALYRQIADNFPDTIDVFGKLYALGIDAWSIVNNLDLLTSNPSARLPGYTGQLSLAPDGRIERELLWARYEDGKSIPVKNIEYTPPVLRANPLPNSQNLQSGFSN